MIWGFAKNRKWDIDRDRMGYTSIIKIWGFTKNRMGYTSNYDQKLDYLPTAKKPYETPVD